MGQRTDETRRFAAPPESEGLLPGSSRRWTLAPALLALPLVLWCSVVIAWATDAALHPDLTPPGVRIAGAPAGRVSHEQLRNILAALNQEVTAATVEIRAGEEVRELTLGELGVSVDVSQTSEAVFSAHDSLHPVSLPLRWFAARVDPTAVPLVLSVDTHRALESLEDVVTPLRRAPVEPLVERTEDGFSVERGPPGVDYHVQEAITSLVRQLRRPLDSLDSLRIELELPAIEVPPKRDEERLVRAARELDEWTDTPLVISMSGHEVTADPEVIRGWWRITHLEDSVEVSFAADVARGWLEQAFAPVRRDPMDATFTVTPFGVQIGESRPGRACCEQGWEETVRSALVSGRTEAELRPRVLQPLIDTETARELQIREPVSSFTTSYTPGQARVKNIHRIAELTRGAVILPGAVFSLNEYVGPRTEEKGFVEAPVIYRGRFRTDVGGGVSQFATTLFNAAFFAGLDFGEYQSHSIYISRYPYGREATVSYPHPDLQIVNDTPYGVLIWTEVTDSTVTVTLWSTRHWEVEQTGQTQERQGACTRVTTERTRRRVTDGHLVTDTVQALYRPTEGVNCA